MYAHCWPSRPDSLYSVLRCPVHQLCSAAIAFLRAWFRVSKGDYSWTGFQRAFIDTDAGLGYFDTDFALISCILSSVVHQLQMALLCYHTLICNDLSIFVFPCVECSQHRLRTYVRWSNFCLPVRTPRMCTGSRHPKTTVPYRRRATAVKQGREGEQEGEKNCARSVSSYDSSPLFPRPNISHPCHAPPLHLLATLLCTSLTGREQGDTDPVAGKSIGCP